MATFDYERMRRPFPDQELPPILRKTLDFCVPLHASFSAEFEFTDCGTTLLGGGLAEFPTPDHFAPFGKDGSGGFWAYWNPEGLSKANMDRTPIVFICGEAVGSTVATSTFDEFLSLLAIGCEELGDKIGDDREISYSDKYRRSNVKNAEFREWLNRELHILPADKPDRIVQKAKREFGRAFVEWYILWQGSRPWSKLPD